MKKVHLPHTMEGRNILIAGAAGFIPSHAAEFYLEQGANVVGLDNFITGSESNIELLTKKYDNFKFHKCNIFESLPNFSKQKFDYILHLASPASPIDFATIPLEIMRVNSEGTLKLLELAKEKGATILMASTSEVYGDPEVHPQVETYFGSVNPIGLRSPYDESKRFSEAMMMTFHRYFQTETRIVRIFNTYGPRMRPNDGRVIPNFINQALKNENITVYGEGTQTRSFCYVTDLVNAINCVLMGSEPTPFNIGSTDEYHIVNVAKKIIKLLNSKSKVIFIPLPNDDPKVRRPDLTKLQTISDYAPVVSFEDGLTRTTDFFRKLAIESGTLKS